MTTRPHRLSALTCLCVPVCLHPRPDRRLCDLCLLSPGAASGLGTLGELSPAVARVAATEGDVLHLEEMAAVLKLEQGAETPVRWSHQTYSSPPAGRPPVRPSASPCLKPPHPTSGPPLRLSLTPRREISRSQEAGGRKWTVSFRAVAIWRRSWRRRGSQGPSHWWNILD